MDLLGLDDLLGGTSPAPAAAPTPLQLRPQPQLSPQVFQQKWGALTNTTKFQHSLSPSAMAFIEGHKHQVGKLHASMLLLSGEAVACFLPQALAKLALWQNAHSPDAVHRELQAQPRQCNAHMCSCSTAITDGPMLACLVSSAAHKHTNPGGGVCRSLVTGDCDSSCSKGAKLGSNSSS